MLWYLRPLLLALSIAPHSKKIIQDDRNDQTKQEKESAFSAVTRATTDDTSRERTAYVIPTLKFGVKGGGATTGEARITEYSKDSHHACCYKQILAKRLHLLES
ncbi:MAG: hypothetical protein ACR2PS_13540, partial [Pseudomonadales bacterium]